LKKNSRQPARTICYTVYIYVITDGSQTDDRRMTQHRTINATASTEKVGLTGVLIFSSKGQRSKVRVGILWTAP